MKSSLGASAAISRTMRAVTNQFFETALGNRNTGDRQVTVNALVSTDDVKTNKTFEHVAARLSDQGITIENVEALQERDSTTTNFTGKTTITMALKRTHG